MTISTNVKQPTQLSIYPSPVGNLGFLSAPSSLGYLPFPALEWWFLTGTLGDGHHNYSMMNNLITTKTDPGKGTADQEIMSSFQFQRHGIEYQAITTYGGEGHTPPGVGIVPSVHVQGDGPHRQMPCQPGPGV